MGDMPVPACASLDTRTAACTFVHTSFSKDTLWIYILGPLLGGMFAGLWQLFNGVNIKKLEMSEAEERDHSAHNKDLVYND